MAGGNRRKTAARATSGPWEANGTAIETVATPSAVIGRAYDEREGCGIESQSEAEANARLIAAAPDLLDALKEVVALSDRKHNAWDKAHAAIAKAEGR